MWCNVCDAILIVHSTRCNLRCAIDFNKRDDTSHTLANIPPRHPQVGLQTHAVAIAMHAWSWRVHICGRANPSTRAEAT
eukprot:7710371-Pyramimonas_sp.AAC.1